MHGLSDTVSQHGIYKGIQDRHWSLSHTSTSSKARSCSCRGGSGRWGYWTYHITYHKAAGTTIRPKAKKMQAKGRGANCQTSIYIYHRTEREWEMCKGKEMERRGKKGKRCQTSTTQPPDCRICCWLLRTGTAPSWKKYRCHVERRLSKSALSAALNYLGWSDHQPAPGGCSSWSKEGSKFLSRYVIGVDIRSKRCDYFGAHTHYLWCKGGGRQSTWGINEHWKTTIDMSNTKNIHSFLKQRTHEFTT